MKTKMNLNVVAESDEERKIESYLNMLHESKEVQHFLETMKQEAEKREVSKYRARIKNVDSAIRTYRINHKKLEDAHDYIGISFITDNEKQIYPIIDYLKEKMPTGDFVDFVGEDKIYSPLVYTKWVPPLGYNVLAKEKLIPEQRKVPIEIRVCSKEGYISEQSAYYSVQKNDTIKMPMEEKNKLRNIVQHITYKLGILCMRNISDEERKKQVYELEEIIKNNEEFLNTNNELYRDALLDFGRLVYRYEHDSEILEMEKELSMDEIDGFDEKLKNTFGNIMDSKEGNIIDRVYQAVNEMRI